MARIELDRVTVRRPTATGDQLVLDETSLDIGEARVALVGPNGAGKSTLARLVNGLVHPSRGQVSVDGLDTVRRGRDVRRRVGFVFTDPDNQIVMPTVAEDVDFSLRRTGLPRAERAGRVRDVLHRFGLGDHADHPPHLLSGGQKQLLALASVLVLRPDVLVADEVTASLDVSVQAVVLNLLRRLQADLGLTMIFISHNLSVVRYMADRIAVMYDGRIVEQGPTADLIGSPQQPYTRSLLAAIPQIGQRRLLSDEGIEASVVSGPANA